MNLVNMHSWWYTTNLFGNCLKTNQNSNYCSFYLCMNAFDETAAIADNRFFLPMSDKLFLNSGEKHLSAAKRKQDLLHEII